MEEIQRKVSGSVREPICGIDEAGRGPIAGPVTAAAVVLGRGFEERIDEDFDTRDLRDSKKLSPKKRRRVTEFLLTHATVGIGWAWPEEIDRLNIHRTSLLAMKRAFEELSSAGFYQNTSTQEIILPALGSVTVGEVLVDGKFTPDLPVPAEAVVKGDASVPEISAASIVAKTVRDLWMIRYSRIEPAWDFDRHKGYPTRRHLELCREHGLSPIHRRSFSILK